MTTNNPCPLSFRYLTFIAFFFLSSITPPIYYLGSLGKLRLTDKLHIFII